MPVEVSAVGNEASARFLVFTATPWMHGPVGGIACSLPL